MTKHSSSIVNRAFVQSYLVFNNVLKTFAQKLYLYITNGTFLKPLVGRHQTFFNVTTCFGTFREHSKLTLQKCFFNIQITKKKRFKKLDSDTIQKYSFHNLMRKQLLQNVLGTYFVSWAKYRD